MIGLTEGEGLPLKKDKSARKDQLQQLPSSGSKKESADATGRDVGKVRGATGSSVKRWLRGALLAVGVGAVGAGATVAGTKLSGSHAQAISAVPSSELDHKKPPRTEYEKFIDQIDVTVEQKEKLLQVLAGYDEAVAMAREFDPKIVAPSQGEVVANLIKLGAYKLEKIAKVMGKPELIIEPANMSFKEMVNAMNMHRYYDGKGKISFVQDPYRGTGGQNKISVSIVDMIQYPPTIVPDSVYNKQKLSAYEKYYREFFSDQSMRLMNDRQYVLIMQRSLRAYAKAKKNGEANPEKYIIDFNDSLHHAADGLTETILNSEHTPHGELLKGYFDITNLGGAEVDFGLDDWDAPMGGLHGRGAVQVM